MLQKNTKSNSHLKSPIIFLPREPAPVGLQKYVILSLLDELINGEITVVIRGLVSWCSSLLSFKSFKARLYTVQPGISSEEDCKQMRTQHTKTGWCDRQ